MSSRSEMTRWNGFHMNIGNNAVAVAAGAAVASVNFAYSTLSIRKQLGTPERSAERDAPLLHITTPSPTSPVARFLYYQMRLFTFIFFCCTITRRGKEKEAWSKRWRACAQLKDFCCVFVRFPSRGKEEGRSEQRKEEVKRS
ncbi:hypothetical protein BDY21DRAFT_151954 [Lineolata rhizophorae]|uniref:Uncharacterized protein n=1 Tax=Lineolata rhizophorae TaxID=578093 RepID=A0A6A6NNF6_9PEZI|nr:hypothetical protein BDY21DRAFT_151954 [Lineolata rhizophorae]